MTKPWAADAFLLASSADCKPHDSDDADMAGPLVLLPPQAEITVEIDDDGNVLLRQECTLGGDPDQIVIARANLSAFLGALIDITPHGRCGFDLGGVPPEWSAEPPTRQPSMP